MSNYVLQIVRSLLERAFILSVVLAAILLPTIQSIAAESEVVDQKPYVIGVLGDSVTRGVWADSSLGKADFRFIRSLTRVRLVRNTAAVSGDGWNPNSGNERHDAEYLSRRLGFLAREHISGFVGEQDYSLPIRLRNFLGRPVKVLNQALLAGTYRTAWVQLEKLESQVRRELQGRAPDMILINLNAMDFVLNTDIEIFEKAVKSTLQRVALAYPGSTVVVTQLLDTVAMISRPDVMAFRAPLSSEPVMCSTMYESTNFGTSMGLKPGADDETVARSYSKLTAMQTILRSEVEALNAASGSYEGFRGKVVLIGDLNLPNGQWDLYLAGDCIHPNVAGQRLLSSKTWDQLLLSGALSQP